MISHVIFDCDGVLIDSEVISMDVDLALLAQSGIHLTVADMHHRFVGATFEDMVKQVEREFGVALPADLSARKDDLMLDLYRRELKPVPGVAAMLQTLRLPASIGTNGPRARALEALKITGLGSYFADRLTTFEDVVNGKPAPDIYELAAFRAGFAPGNCVVVEDSETGARAALAAGCHVIGFTGVAHDLKAKTNALRNLGINDIINDMAALHGAIAAIRA
jgi:HAD superfamily hydrolase (TIGR01509 family)